MRLQSLLPLASSFLLLNVSTALEGSTAQDQVSDAVSLPYRPAEDISGTLTIHRGQALEYLKEELGIDVDKLQSHPELFDPSPSGDYTFPEESGVEGTLSWDLSGREEHSAEVIKRFNCNDCMALCGGLTPVPFGAIACIICASVLHCW